MSGAAIAGFAADRYQRLHGWALGADPGLIRLRDAVRATVSLGLALLVLTVVTHLARQPITVALLGAVVVMVSARVRGESRRNRVVTILLLPVPAALVITVSALLMEHRTISDAVFVAIVFAAVHLRRFGGRGTALGTVAFMSYFFTLFLGSTIAELPWLITAVTVGALCSALMIGWLMPQRADRVLRASLSALWARMAAVVDAVVGPVRTGRLDESSQRRLRERMARLGEVVLLIQSQIEDDIGPAMPWPGMTAKELSLRLFDTELTVERVAGAATVTATAKLAVKTRTALGDALIALAGGLRELDDRALRCAGDAVRPLICPQVTDDRATASRDIAVNRLAFAVIAAARTIIDVRAALRRDVTSSDAKDNSTVDRGRGGTEDGGRTRNDADGTGGKEVGRGVSPTTRQAIQATLAVALTIVAGEWVSPGRWYWAVVAAFVIFAGTSSRGETLTKGWQRLLGTALGVPAGMVIATAAGDRVVLSVVLIFGCVFCALYVMQLSYSLMMFWITTTLALLYGLLGQFAAGLLLLRLEETAVGAIIGASVAVLVLPAHTGTAVLRDAREFLAALTDLVAEATDPNTGAPRDDLTVTARRLGRSLDQLRASAKPLTDGIGGLAGRHSVRRMLQILTACDHYARTLARYAERFTEPTGADGNELADAVAVAGHRIRANIAELEALLDHRPTRPIIAATEELDAVHTLTLRDAPRVDRPDELLAAQHALRHIDLAVGDVAVELAALSPA